jgi:hypothetical protein
MLNCPTEYLPSQALRSISFADTNIVLSPLFVVFFKYSIFWFDFQGDLGENLKADGYNVSFFSIRLLMFCFTSVGVGANVFELPDEIKPWKAFFSI